MENWFQTLQKFLRDSSAWIEGFYSDHTGLVALLGLGLAGVGLLLAYRALVKPKQTGSEDSSTDLDPALRLLLLNKVQKERVEPRLRQGLREAIRVDLGLTETPGAVRPRLQVYAQQESGSTAVREIQGPIRHIFDQTAGGRLLILGEPGTGKTNLLLELAQSLVADAKQDETHPIPIIFSLPRWTPGKRARTLGEWMQDDLADEYGVSRAAAEALVRQDRILPLLDGLDEVAQDRRTACVDAIHAYQESRNLGRLAVCCRVAQYAGLPDLDLRAAIRVEKLTREDVEREICKPGLEYVRRALESDPELWEVVDTPLWLHVLFGAARVEWSSASQQPPPRERLYARYVEYALGREATDSPRRRTAREPLLRWLGWLAAEMRRRDQAQFAFENLNGSWLAAPRTQLAARWLAVAVGGLLGGLFGGLLGGLVGGLVVGLLSGLFAGLFVGLGAGLVVNIDVGAIEDLRFAPREAKAGLVDGLRDGLVVGLVGGLVGGVLGGLVDGLVGGLVVGLLSGLFAGLFVGLFNGLLRGLRPRPVSEHSAPNRGTLRSLRYALRIAVSGCALVALLLIASQSPLSGADIKDRLVVGVIGATWLVTSLLSLAKGGLFALRHYTVRLFLWGLGSAPLRYVRFLNEAAERLFLIRRGGSYEFFHLTFRDYMAETHGPKAPNSS